MLRKARGRVPNGARPGAARAGAPTVVCVRFIALVLLALLSFAPAAWAVSWRRPVPGVVARPFALSADRYAAGQHRGVDLAAGVGTRVRAACAGRVTFAGSVPGGGRTVSVGCGRLVATYQGLGAIAVARGDVVMAGAAIGVVGRSGDRRDPRPHLHLGAREAASRRYLDPLTLLGSSPPAAAPGPVAPRRRPVAPVPAPRPRVVRPHPVALPRPLARFSPALDAPPARSPLVVWIGLAAFGLGLPLGGLVTLRRRRRDAARTRGWAAAHR